MPPITSVIAFKMPKIHTFFTVTSFFPHIFPSHFTTFCPSPNLALYSAKTTPDARDFHFCLHRTTPQLQLRMNL
jgi:hypothetical protein